MFDLNEILDDVQAKYYKSSNLIRPSISWSKDYWTDYIGIYNYYNNHIEISRILNSSEITYEMLSSVAYRESLHQDFPECNQKFNQKAELFPNYNEIGILLDYYAANYHATLQYTSNYNNFTAGKKIVVYILLPKLENYFKAFYSYDGIILVEFDVKVCFDVNTYSKDVFYVFLVQDNDKYYIAAWCKKGNLLSQVKKVNNKLCGDYDNFSYQFTSEFNDVYILPLTNCDYSFPINTMPADLKCYGCCSISAKDQFVKMDLGYINSYCEGYFNMGFDPKLIDVIPQFIDLSLKQLQNIKESGYRSVWNANAVFLKEPNYENLYAKAESKKDSWLLSLALTDYLDANKLCPDNIQCVEEIVKLCAILRRKDIGRIIIDKYGTDFLLNDKLL